MKKIKLILSVFFGTLFAFLIISCGEKPHVHNLIEHERKEATCENDGYEAYVECTDCDYTTYKVIKAKGHDFDSNYLYNATKHYHKCKKCDAIKDEDNHNFAWIIDKYATEDEIGIKHEKCNICEYTRNENTIIDKLTHTHNMLHVVKVDKTCTKDGNIEYYHCSKCEKNYLDKNGDNEVVDVVIKASHEYGDYHEEINATCSKEGTKGHYECSVCHTYFDANKNKLNSLIIEKKSHDYKWVIDKPATEEEFGLKHEECNVCHYTRNENTIIVKLNHTHNMEHVLKIDKTCTKDGNIEYYHCSKCNKNYLDKNGVNEVIDVVIKASHEYGSFINEVDSTCTNEGTKGHYECSACHNYFDANKNKLDGLVIAKKAHVYKNEWSHDESTHYHECKVCNNKKEISSHNYITNYEGYDKCSICDYEDKRCKVYFDVDGGEQITTQKYEYKTIIYLPVPKKNGYDFVGWEYNDRLCNKIEVNKNITLKAIWTKDFEFKLLDDGTIEIIKYTGNDKIVELPKHTTIIGNYAFRGCSSLKKVKILEGCTSIGESAFSGCNNLTSIDIPSSVTIIGDSVFSGCSSLTSIEIPSSVTSIGRHAFWGCSSLTSIKVDSNNKVYDSRDNCNTIIKTSTNTLLFGCMETVILSSVTSIGRYAFSGCNNLTSIEIPSSVTSIGDNAFSGCSSLTSIEIPSSVTSIGVYAFSGCRSLTSIEIPSSVTSIGDNAFSSCSSLTSIEIPNNFTSIGSHAFEDCSGLISIEIPDNVTSIGSYAFKNCNSLPSIEIPSGVISIGAYAFYDCSSLTNIEIPSSVISIEIYAFYGCSSLTSITLPFVGESKNSNTYLGYIFGAPYFSNRSNYIPKSLKKVIILEGCTIIHYKAFSGCSSLTSIEIPNSVTSIDSYAFYGCSSLTSIEIPSSVTSIGYEAFSSCSNLTSIEIINGVASIEDYTFKDCSSLTSITLPNSITKIGYGAFYGCSSLTSVFIPSSVTNIDSDLFEDCKFNLTIYCEVPSKPSGWSKFWNSSNHKVIWGYKKES